MPRFSTMSKQRLAECDYRIQEILNEAIKHMDFTVVCGFRGEEEQDKAYREGKSKVRFPRSKHNQKPSLAVDIAPCRGGTIPWNDVGAFILLAGFILAIACLKKTPLRWGGDWDSDRDMTDQTFNDYPHFEIIEE